MKETAQWLAGILLMLTLVGYGVVMLTPISVANLAPTPQPQPTSLEREPTPAQTTPLGQNPWRQTFRFVERSDELPPNENPALAPLRNLNIVVLTADARPLASGSCVVGGDRRAADGSGFINFAVTGSVVARCAAPGHIPTRVNLPPGDHRVHLEAGAGSPVVATSACGSSTDPNENRRECARQIAAVSANWTECAALGHDAACHRYVREVARALAAADPHWGLISKPRGQHSCSETACGADVGGYGQDVAAYRPTGAAAGEWIGFDLVAGAGAPGATVIWNGPLPRRPDNLWATVPR